MQVRSVRWPALALLVAIALMWMAGPVLPQDGLESAGKRSEQPGDGSGGVVVIGTSRGETTKGPNLSPEVTEVSPTGQFPSPLQPLHPTPAARPSQGLAGTRPNVLSASPSEAADRQPLKPIPDPLESDVVEIEAASFKGVTPGVTTMKEVEEAWGAPKEIERQGTQLMGLYAVEPFDRVEVSYFNGKVASVVIRLDRVFPANTVAQQLELTNIRPVLVSNEMGEILGQAYPERGVLFAFEPSAQAGKASMVVSQIILEPINAEPFVLRAETNLGTGDESCLADLREALRLNPGNARAHWLHSRVMMARGDLEKAVAASGQAVRLDPSNAQYRVTRAEILGQVGRVKEGIQEAQLAAEAAQHRPHVKARALCLLGDLVASGAKPDYKRAIQHHMEAAKLADKLVADRHPAIRLAAKETLIDAHLGAAHDIAWGDWKQKEEAVNRWLSCAEAFVAELIESDGGDQEHRFRFCTRALAACVGLRGSIDPEKWTKDAIRTGKQLIAATDDPARKARFQWDLGMALYDTLQIYQMRSDHDAALKYGEWAIEYLEQGQQQAQTVRAAYLLGRLYFRLGAIHAIRDQNHRAAITWFDKAVPLLQKPLPSEAASDLGRHGETFVSMGVSYWESGQRDKAVELTQRGVELMEEAVGQGWLSDSALAVPYGNLASMHRHLGLDEKADRFESMAARSKNSRLQ